MQNWGRVLTVRSPSRMTPASVRTSPTIGMQTAGPCRRYPCPWKVPPVSPGITHPSSIPSCPTKSTSQMRRRAVSHKVRKWSWDLKMGCFLSSLSIHGKERKLKKGVKREKSILVSAIEGLFSNTPFWFLEQKNFATDKFHPSSQSVSFAKRKAGRQASGSDSLGCRSYGLWVSMLEYHRRKHGSGDIYIVIRRWW